MKRRRVVSWAGMSLGTVGLLVAGCATSPDKLAFDSALGKQNAMFGRPYSESTRIVACEDAIRAYDNYLAQYPRGKYVDAATHNKQQLQGEIEEIRLAPQMKAELAAIGDDMAKLQDFVRRHPTGSQKSAAMEARERIEKLIIDEVTRSGPGQRLVIQELQPARYVQWHGVVDSKNSATIAAMGQMEAVQCEYPGDSVPFVDTGILPVTQWSSGSVIRFKDRHTWNGFVFDGLNTDPLSFLLLDSVGLVYLHGSGTITLTSGKRITLP